MKKSEFAVEKFLNGHNCAQSVLYSFCEDLNLDEDTAMKIASGFGGRMGRKGEVCGAVSGGIMTIGMKYGSGKNPDSSKTGITYRKTRELMDRFAEKHGCYICRKLLEGCELSTDEGQKEFKEKGLKTRVCKQCIISAVEIVEDILT